MGLNTWSWIFLVVYVTGMLGFGHTAFHAAEAAISATAWIAKSISGSVLNGPMLKRTVPPLSAVLSRW